MTNAAVFIKTYCIIRDGSLVLLTKDIEGQQGWKFPGGHVEAKELVCSAAVREVEEELGIRISLKKIILIEDYFNQKRPDEHNINFFIEAEKSKGKVIPNSTEVACYRYFDLSELKRINKNDFYPPHWDALQYYLGKKSTIIPFLNEVKHHN